MEEKDLAGAGMQLLTYTYDPVSQKLGVQSPVLVIAESRRDSVGGFNGSGD